ncbi:MAG: hypothetical protein R3274_06635 [Desulfobacterales bacterium]|nr:hypothetical protein [Desulfobacterales bacterium]
MILRHAALTCSSERNSDRFFKDLLGLEKETPKTLAPSLARAIFNVDTELMMINYRSENVHFEIFITGKAVIQNSPIDHVCLEVKDLEAFVAQCHRLEMGIIKVTKGDRILTFIRDDDGHLFEIK